MWKNGPGRVAVDIPVDWVVSVAGHVDTFGRCAGVVVDGFVVWPRGGYFRDVTYGTENASAGMD